jgi:hypothetical protein
MALVQDMDVTNGTISKTPGYLLGLQISVVRAWNYRCRNYSNVATTVYTIA